MTDNRQTPSDPFDRALADWHGGRFEAALSGLRAATRSGDAGCASLLLQMSADPSAPGGARAAAAEALLSAPDQPLMRRHAGFIRASGYGMTADPAAALSQRIDEARGGDTQAMAEIGLLSCLSGANDRALPVLEAAAAAGSAAAVAALLRLAIEAGQSSPDIRRHAAALARSGHPLAASLVPAANALPDRPVPASRDDADLAWPDAKALLAAIEALPAQPSDTLNDQPLVARRAGFMPSVLCDYLAAQAAPLLRPAQIFDGATGQTRPDPHRQSMTAALPDGAMDLVLWAVKRRMAGLAGGNFEQGEPLAVLLYRPGEQYRPHVDFLSEDGHAASADLARRGQRVATSLVRLNQEFTGGDTVFPRLDIRWTGQRGDALSFANINPAGQGDPMTLHAGEPVQTGLKILASLWLRERV
ncbi:prolyl hydroxylase family protein [Maricaulis salignorans]|uniref:prolyl hydroxylase family protein n=1 Tax=Maricaulis salignorans TaxID=144026 RepID=UPI003A8E94EE